LLIAKLRAYAWTLLENLHCLEFRLVTSKFSTIVLGGTAALHAYLVWGAVLFFMIFCLIMSIEIVKAHDLALSVAASS
jgi:hypothetical protein